MRFHPSFIGLLSRLRRGFNLPSFVDAAFKQLQADIVLSSAVTIGELSPTPWTMQPDACQDLIRRRWTSPSLLSQLLLTKASTYCCPSSPSPLFKQSLRAPSWRNCYLTSATHYYIDTKSELIPSSSATRRRLLLVRCNQARELLV